MTNSTTGAWHPDPTGRHEHRWWDGTQWTERVADGGVTGTDPVSSAPVSTAAASPEPVSTAPATTEPVSPTPASSEPVSTTPASSEPVSTVVPSPGAPGRRRPDVKVIAAVVAAMVVIGVVATLLLTRSDGASRDDAMDACLESGSDRSHCECVVDEYVDAGGSLDEFVDVADGDFEDPEDLPEGLVDAFLECLTR